MILAPLSVHEKVGPAAMNAVPVMPRSSGQGSRRMASPTLISPPCRTTRQDATFAKYLLTQAWYQRVHLLARLAVAGYFQSNVAFLISYEKDMALPSLRKVQAGDRDVLLHLPGLKAVVFQGFLIHHQDLAQVTGVSTAVALQTLGGDGAGGIDRVRRCPFDAGRCGGSRWFRIA